MEQIPADNQSLSKKLKEVSTRLNSLSEEMKDVPRQLKEVRQEIKAIKKGQAKEWLDGQEVAQILNISLRTLQYMRHSGQIPFTRFHNKLFYKAADVDAILETNYLTIYPKKQ